MSISWTACGIKGSIASITWTAEARLVTCKGSKSRRAFSKATDLLTSMLTEALWLSCLMILNFVASHLLLKAEIHPR